MAATALAAGGLAAGALPGTATAATSHSLPAKYAKYKNCPINNKKVTYCLAASSNSAFSIGSTTLDSNGPVTLSLGLIPKGDGFTVVTPTNGTPALSAKPIAAGYLVPGLGLSPLAVYATPELVGTPNFNIMNFESESGTAFTLPLAVHLTNPTGLLGNTCTIGAKASPITLKLTDGTTSPPKPNKPISGGIKSLSADSNGVLTASGVKLVDNSFYVPGASGCATLLGLVNIDGLVDGQKNLPSAAGTNTAILTGSSGLAPASVIRKYLK
jgi:hypothetical protein